LEKMSHLYKEMTALGIASILGMPSLAVHAQIIVQNRAEDLYNQGIRKTRQEDYRGAIADLQRAANLFNQQRNSTNAYKSKALAIYLQFLASRLQSGGNSEPLPNWYKSGRCLGTPICQYGIVWAAPASEQTAFGGILILTEKLRMLNRPDGSGEPIDAVLDVQIVPKLRPGEVLSTNCQFREKTEPELLAIVQTRGFENADLYTQVRQAWRVNLRTKTIVTIPNRNITCVNNCPGGC
jgi:hypothetical protein